MNDFENSDRTELTDAILKKALAGDIHAFESLFSEFHGPLKSYLFRLLASRADAEDISHDAFIRAFDKLHTYRGEASLKTWVFRIATNLAYNLLKQRKRWTVDATSRARELVMNDPGLADVISSTARDSPEARYEIQEHIDTCFTCVSKTLPLENQVALILKDVYQFSVAEICMILASTEGRVKYSLQTARATMSEIFDQRCALVNKNGICNQCSELNGWFNPKQHEQETRIRDAMTRNPEDAGLYELRLKLVQAVDPLTSPGNVLQEVLMNCNRLAMGEVAGIARDS